MNVAKAVREGLQFRPFRETVRAAFEWRKNQGAELKAGISAERERELLRKWREKP